MGLMIKAGNQISKLGRLLEEKGVLLADGAVGTNLFAAGLVSGDAPELWNANQPDKISNLYRGFIHAGADIILTNSFGGTRNRLKLHHAETRVIELNRKSAEIAGALIDEVNRNIVIAGSIGPTGELLSPLGALTRDEAMDAFYEQMEGLKTGWCRFILDRNHVFTCRNSGRRHGSNQT